MLVLSSSCGLVWPFLLISSDEQLSKFMINTKWMQKHSELKLLQNFQNFEKMNVLIGKYYMGETLQNSCLLLRKNIWSIPLTS
jgi:hypothetical protein